MDNSSNSIYWFALKVFFNRVFELEAYFKETGLECYFPCETTLVEKNGIKKKVRRPVVSSFIFFRSTPSAALNVQKALIGKAFLYTRQVEYRKVPIAISDREMNIFILVTSSGEQGLEYLGDDKMEFHTGDKVRVTDGPFKGAEGHIHRIKGNRRLIVTIEGICAVATSYIPQCFLQKIN